VADHLKAPIGGAEDSGGDHEPAQGGEMDYYGSPPVKPGSTVRLLGIVKLA